MVGGRTPGEHLPAHGSDKAAARCCGVPAHLRAAQHPGLRLLGPQPRRDQGQVGCAAGQPEPSGHHRGRHSLHLRLRCHHRQLRALLRAAVQHARAGQRPPGWLRVAQGLQQLWTARSGMASASPGTPLAGGGRRPALRGAEQAFAVQCDEAPSPPASAYSGLQRLLLRRSGVTALPYLWSFDEPCATWPVRGQAPTLQLRTPPPAPSWSSATPPTRSLPLQDAIAMTRQLANARLLVVHGYGHTAFLNPSTCAQQLHDRLLPHRRPPARGEPYAARTSRRPPPPAG